MKKLALFVEGLTEQTFAYRLIEEVAGKHNISVQLLKGMGPSCSPSRFTQIHATSPDGATFHIMICDCSGETSVLSDIRNQYPTLAREGYDKVLGLRDVYPKAATEAPKMLSAMAAFIPKGAVPVEMLLAVAEIEAWFLSEGTHYQKIHADLTADVVNRLLGGPPEQVDVESVSHPANLLDNIYRAVGLRYTKQRNRIERTINELDCALLYLDASLRVPSLGRFCRELDLFLT